MVKTLLLCFIHGFKGDEETFFEFPDALKKSVSEKSPHLNVQTRVYPKYETRGDLAACVETFREWLQDQVTDLERDAATPSAILEPSVGVILVAHSMGGFVAADALFSVLDNRPVSNVPGQKLMFPLIHGVLTFDTPFNGLSRSMFAYGAFSQYQNLSSVWNIFSTVSSSLTGASTSSALATTAEASSWMRWQTLAARTGTYGAIVAGGVAAYIHRDSIRTSLSKIKKEDLNPYNINYKDNVSRGLTYVSRDSIGEGFAWMASHLKFVGALMKQAQLTTRMERLSQLEGVGIKDLYTSLGENGYWSGGYFVPKRTFCAVPTEKEAAAAKLFQEQPNKKAKSEIEAHCSMFRPEKNEMFDEMLEISAKLVSEWAKNDPRKIVDEYKPTREQLTRTQSESQLWDDDGKMLSPRLPKEKDESEDEFQLQAILGCAEMPQLVDGGVDEESLKRAADTPLPVDEDLMKRMKGDDGEEEKELKKAMVVPLPADDLVV
ncbi:hypothetical protein IFR04_014304 [Cadophora malorum]|uniref:DUF676 domain-containing protein n=1 Tax=Cadophora malorum TaxID=108018 RepID=A0A8H7T534_9HELO|nr:hypothetical protein IFR04_014304 [Cadophora malorum]